MIGLAATASYLPERWMTAAEIGEVDDEGATQGDAAQALDERETGGDEDTYHATIRRTSHGVAHITGETTADVAALMRTGKYRLLSAQISEDNKSTYVVGDWIRHHQYAGTDATPTSSVIHFANVTSSLSDRAEKSARM